MLRITKTFENDSTAIYKIEGKITNESLGVWTEEISALKKVTNRQIILDFCQVWFMSMHAVEILLELMSNDFYLLNCPIEVRNVLHATGLSARMLE